jgi:hypothetical protein
MIECEGYSAAEPMDEGELDVLYGALLRQASEHRYHNQDGFVCGFAGGPECTALGHTTDPDDPWVDDDDHPAGWDGDAVCPATKSGSACTECETDDCDAFWDKVTPVQFWALFAAVAA